MHLSEFIEITYDKITKYDISMCHVLMDDDYNSSTVIISINNTALDDIYYSINVTDKITKNITLFLDNSYYAHDTSIMAISLSNEVLSFLNDYFIYDNYIHYTPPIRVLDFYNITKSEYRKLVQMFNAVSLTAEKYLF